MNPDLWHSHGADRCGPPCSALESEDTCSALDVRRTCSALEVELSPLGDCYAQWPFWLRRSAARLAWPLHRAEDDPQLHGHGGGEHRIAPAEHGLWAASFTASGIVYCGRCGNPDCPLVSAAPYWDRCPATRRTPSDGPSWLWMITTCRDPSVATCDLPPRAAVWFESWPDPRQIYLGDDGSTMLHLPVTAGRSQAASVRLDRGAQ